MARKPGNLRAFLGHFLFRRVSWVGAAMLLLSLFAVFHLLGWRDDTAIISGTWTSPNPRLAAIRGVLYALSYFSAVVVSPILLLAAGINAVLGKLSKQGS